jgi:hypothetical protein
VSDTIPSGDSVAELQELRERMARIEDHRGSVCESSQPENACGPVEYSDREGVPLCAECYAALVKEGEQEVAKAIDTLTNDYELFEDMGAAIVNGQRYSQVLVRVVS